MLIFSLCSNFAFAECDYSTGVSPLPDGRFAYTRECHIKNGENKRDLETANKQIEKLNQALDLKDLALAKSEERTGRWMDTAFKIQDKMETVASASGKNNAVYYGLGVATAILAVWAAGQLR